MTSVNAGRVDHRDDATSAQVAVPCRFDLRERQGCCFDLKISIGRDAETVTSVLSQARKDDAARAKPNARPRFSNAQGFFSRPRDSS